MRTVQRDRRDIWYALYEGQVDVMDADGNYTGEKRASYSAPVKARMNVSGGKGAAAVEVFGLDSPFKRTAVTGDLATPFNTDTVFWFGVEPGVSADVVPHNYRCTDVSRTVNQVVIALEEVTVQTPPVVSG